MSEQVLVTVDLEDLRIVLDRTVTKSEWGKARDRIRAASLPKEPKYDSRMFNAVYRARGDTFNTRGFLDALTRYGYEVVPVGAVDKAVQEGERRVAFRDAEIDRQKERTERLRIELHSQVRDRRKAEADARELQAEAAELRDQRDTLRHQRDALRRRVEADAREFRAEVEINALKAEIEMLRALPKVDAALRAQLAKRDAEIERLRELPSVTQVLDRISAWPLTTRSGLPIIGRENREPTVTATLTAIEELRGGDSDG